MLTSRPPHCPIFVLKHRSLQCVPQFRWRFRNICMFLDIYSFWSVPGGDPRLIRIQFLKIFMFCLQIRCMTIPWFWIGSLGELLIQFLQRLAFYSIFYLFVWRNHCSYFLCLLRPSSTSTSPPNRKQFVDGNLNATNLLHVLQRKVIAHLLITYSLILIYICIYRYMTDQKQIWPYHDEHTRSRLITEVKHRRARIVLGWGTAWEHLVP